MSLFVDLFRTRLLPAFVAALGASFIAAGLMSYVSGGTPDDIFSRPTLRPVASLVAGASGEPIEISPDPFASDNPSFEPSLEPSPSRAPSVAPFGSASARPSGGPSVSPAASGSPKTTVAPSGSGSAKPSGSGGTAATPEPSVKPTPKPSSSSAVARVATRVVVPALGIDLAVIKPPGGPSTYPVCNVAMYIQSLSQPGKSGATYLYAHARAGMFLSIPDASKVNNGRRMIGLLVQVYTSDNMVFPYEIYQVRRHQLTLNDALATKSETLWLQTSEGPRGTPGKTQVIAKPISSSPADPADAHPPARPVVCG